jgi:hypothetical protein
MGSNPIFFAMLFILIGGKHQHITYMYATEIDGQKCRALPVTTFSKDIYLETSANMFSSQGFCSYYYEQY